MLDQVPSEVPRMPTVSEMGSPCQQKSYFFAMKSINLAPSLLWELIITLN
jgi:hypothetical protein